MSHTKQFVLKKQYDKKKVRNFEAVFDVSQKKNNTLIRKNKISSDTSVPNPGMVCLHDQSLI